MKRKVPDFASDEEAEAFLEQDLSDLDFSQFKPVEFEFLDEPAELHMKLPRGLLEEVKALARDRGIPYTQLIQELMEKEVAG
jgi:predicted DNA binding CopG/RHH family protein